MPNLIYTKNATFFKKLGEAASDVKRQLQKQVNWSEIKFDASDEDEIGRGHTYAVFEDLEALDHLSIDSIKASLARHGIKDEGFQNKILYCMIQRKAGVHFRLGSIISDLMLEKDLLLTLSKDYRLSLEVSKFKKNQVTLIYETPLREDMGDNKKVPALDVSIRITITPEAITVADFKVKQCKGHKTEAANTAAKLIGDNQKSILSMLMTWLQRISGKRSDLILDKEEHFPLSPGK